jgi:hypothetical protein
MAYFVKVEHPVIGNSYITFVDGVFNCAVDILGEYMEPGVFEYYNGNINDITVQLFLYELRSGLMPSHGIPASDIEMLIDPWLNGFAARFPILNIVGVDPKLLRLREMMKRI